MIIESEHEVDIINMLEKADRPPAIPSMRIVEVEIPSSETRELRQRNGKFQAIVMPQFMYPLVDLVKIDEKLFMEKMENIVTAIKFIHGLGYVRIHSNIIFGVAFHFI